MNRSEGIPNGKSVNDFLAKNETFHIARVTIKSKLDLSYHNHNYAELLWIEHGSGIHHINGKEVPVQEHELIMIRPEDIHTFSTKGHPMTLVNIAFPLDTLRLFRERYFPNLNSYFWICGTMPYQTTLSEKLSKRFSSQVEETMKSQRTYLQLDCLQLFIFRNLSLHESGIPHSESPAWLTNAISNYNTAECFRKGIVSFAALCERNPDYVNRIVKEIFHETLTEFVNDIRIKYAANELVLTNTPIKTISDFCGFTSLAYFYKQFKLRFGQIPMKYREMHQTITRKKGF